MPLLTDQSSRKTRPFTGPAAEPPRTASSGTAARRPHQVGYNLGSRRDAVASARLGRAQLIGCSVRPQKTHSPSPPTDLGGSMKRVIGIGGIFFKAKDAPALQAWYKRHLGIDVQEWGGTAFTWTDGEGKPVAGTTVWSICSAQGDHFAPSTATFMVNYRVEDLHALVKVLREEGCNVLEKIDDSEYGKFAWVIDPEGNKVELWQPPAGQ